MSYFSHFSLAGTTINWPTSGGIEEWGFSRPYGCAFDDQYLMQLANKMHEKSNWGRVEGVYKAKAGEYTNGSTGQLIKQGKNNPAATKALQNEINDIQNDINKLDQHASNYRSRFGSNYANNTEVINAVKSFSLNPVNCINSEAAGQANLIACGMQGLAFTITANVERFIQISCHIGGNVPSYAQASMPNNKISSLDTSDNTSSASSSSAGKNILKGLAAAVGVYTGIQEAKQNSNNREAVKSSATPKYYESRENMIARNVNQCIGQRTKGDGIHFVNNCNFDIHMVYCHLNNENTDQITYACDQWYPSEIKLKPGEVSYERLKTGSAQLVACRKLENGNNDYSRLQGSHGTHNYWPQKSPIDSYSCEASPQYR